MAELGSVFAAADYMADRHERLVEERKPAHERGMVTKKDVRPLAERARSVCAATRGVPYSKRSSSLVRVAKRMEAELGRSY